MDLVVDANVLFAIMIKKGITERLLLLDDLHLYGPEYLFLELRSHEDYILERTKRNPAEFLHLFDIFERRIELIPLSEFRHHLKHAEMLLEDKDDAAYLALCLSKQLPLWSNDVGFKKQTTVPVFTTQDLIALFRVDKRFII